MWIVKYSEYRNSRKVIVERNFLTEDDARGFVSDNAMVFPLPDCEVAEAPYSDEPPF
jgi:hypothetical protein